MITNFLGANLEFKVRRRDDAESGACGYDLDIELYQRRDASFSQSISFPCITSGDLDAMIVELQKAREIVATSEKLEKLQQS